MATLSSVPCLVFLLLLCKTSMSAETVLSHGKGQPEAADWEGMKPATAMPEVHLPVYNSTRRRLGRFQICAICTCCGGPKNLCLSSPCCYAISCNIPNRPFGFCSFVPKACNCFGCHL